MQQCLFILYVGLQRTGYTEELLEIRVFRPDETGFIGTLYDTIGYPQKISADSADPETAKRLQLRNVVFDLLRDIINDSADSSTFFCCEEMSSDTSKDFYSIKDLYEHFQSDPETLEKVLRKTQILITKGNTLFRENVPALMLNPTKQQLEAIENNINKLFKQIHNAKNFAKIKDKLDLDTPILVSVDINKVLPGSSNKLDFDRQMKNMCAMRFPKIASQLDYGVTKVYDLLSKRRSAALDDYIGSANGFLKNVLKTLSNKNESFSSPKQSLLAKGNYRVENHVHRCASRSYLRFMKSLRVYAKRRVSEDVTHSRYVALLPDDEPRFATFIAQHINGKNLLSIFNKAKYTINSVVIDEDEDSINSTIAQMWERQEGAPLEGRSGLHEIDILCQKVCAILLSIDLEMFDKSQAEATKYNPGNTVRRSYTQESIERCVMTDFRAISDRIILFISQYLKWFFKNVVDATLVVERNIPREDQDRLNLFDYDYATLKFRSKVNMAFEQWIDNVSDVLKSFAAQANTLSTEKIKNFYANALDILHDQSEIDEYITNPSNLTSKVADKLSRLFKVKSKSQVNSMTTPSSQDILLETSQSILKSFFGEEINVAKVFTEDDDQHEEKSLKYARKFFNDLKLRFIFTINHELTSKFQNFAEEQSNSILNLPAIIRGFVFFPVIIPLFLGVHETPADCKIDEFEWDFDKRKAVPIIKYFSDDDAHNQYLIDLYDWRTASLSGISKTSSEADANIFNALEKRKVRDLKGNLKTPSSHLKVGLQQTPDYGNLDAVQEFAKLLRQKGLSFQIHNVAGDGNCFFHAAIDQLQHYGQLDTTDPNSLVSLEPNHFNNMSAYTCRKECVAHVVKNYSSYQPFLSPDYSDVNTYQTTMSNSTTFVDNAIIAAFADLYNLNVVIYSDIYLNETSSASVPTCIPNPTVHSRFTITLGLWTDAHYYSLVK